MSLSFPDGPMVGPPRALLHLCAAISHRRDVQIELIDALAEPDDDRLAQEERPVLFGLSPEEVARRARAIDPDLIGISTMANYYRRETLELVHALREAVPDALIVLGGPDPTVDGERYLAECPADAVCIGEGEATFAELVDAAIDGRDPMAVHGLLVRDGTGLRQTGPRALLDDLSSTVPDYSRIDLERYFDLARRGWRARPTFRRPGIERTVDLVTTRGCPYRCSFCVIHASMGRRFRTRAISGVIEQLRVLSEQHGVQHVHFEDDIINLSRKRFRALLHALIEADLPLTWDTPNGLRADLLDAEIIDLCKRAGCTYVIFGIESGDQEVLDTIVDKEMRLERVTEAARLCHEAELDALAFYIIGMPGESAEDVHKTVEYAFSLFERFGTTPLLQIWRPYVQTALHDQAQAAGSLAPADPAVLHARSGIPYTQFRDRSLTGALSPESLATTFHAYGERLAAGQLARWRRAGERVSMPAEPTDARRHIEAFVLFEAPFLHAKRRWRPESALTR